MDYFIGHQLRKIRTDLGYSQEYLAKKLKIAQSTYSEIENNEEGVTLGKLNKIAEVLEKNPLELIQLNGQPIINMHDNSQNGMVINNNSINTELLQNLSNAVTKLTELLKDK